MKSKIGTKESPMVLKTPPLSSEYTMHVDEKDGKEILVCTVGKTVLHYNIACLTDLHAMLYCALIGFVHFEFWKKLQTVSVC